jgi:hypothetical protein
MVLAPKRTVRKEALVMVYIGVELHRKTTQVAAVNGEGELLVNRKVPTSGPDILRVFGDVAAEATPTAIALRPRSGGDGSPTYFAMPASRPTWLTLWQLRRSPTLE